MSLSPRALQAQLDGYCESRTMMRRWAGVPSWAHHRRLNQSPTSTCRCERMISLRISKHFSKLRFPSKKMGPMITQLPHIPAHADHFPQYMFVS